MIECASVIERTWHVERLTRLLRQFPVVALVGARQVGKSTLARAAAERASGGATILDLEDPRALARALRAVRRHDAIVTVGGVSVGDRDLVRAALEAAGARIDFWRVAMRPGKPFAFGRWGRAAVFGLPGNPASALVTFELFVRPALRLLAGLRGSGRLLLPARLSERVEKPAGLAVYLRVRLRREGSALVAQPLPTQVSGNLSSAALLDGLAILPAGRAAVGRGATLEVIVLRAPAGAP